MDFQHFKQNMDEEERIHLMEVFVEENKDLWEQFIIEIASEEGCTD